MKTLKTALLIFFLGLSFLSVLQFWQIKPVQATSIFTDGYESNDFSAWTGNETTATYGILSTQGTTKYAGSYAANCTVMATGGWENAYAYKTYTAAATVFTSIAIYIDSFSGTENLRAFITHISSFGGQTYASIGMTTSRYLYQRYYLTNGTTIEDTSATQLSLDSWYLLQLKSVISSGTSGEARVYLNETEVADLNNTGLTNQQGADLIGCSCVGIQSAYNSASMVYVDNVVVSDVFVTSAVNWWQYTFDFQDLDSNTAVGVTWGLYNSSTLLTYTQGSYNLLDGTYTLKSYFRGNLINSTDLATATYGNSTITINLSIKSYGTTGTASIYNYSYSITADNGSITAIQAAVNTVHAQGNGTVYIPVGISTFNPTGSVTGADGYVCGIKSWGGINIIGVGSTSTILQETTNPPTSSSMFSIDGRNGYPFRISGIKFQGYSDTEAVSDSGITVLGASDYRIDNCYLDNFSSAAIYCTNIGGNNRGLIDHCNITATYKMKTPPGGGWIWAYGVVVWDQDYHQWSTDVSLLGQYYGTKDVVYIEDCLFNATRHAAANSQNGYYVMRYCNITNEIPENFGSIDSHGFNAGRGLEAYNNTVTATSGYGYAQAIWLRGGTDTVFNNTFVNCQFGTQIFWEPADSPPYPNTNPVRNTYIWSNTMSGGGTAFYNNAPTHYTENVDYWLSARGSYTAFTYPHPNTVGSSGSTLGYIGFNGTATCSFDKVSDSNITFTASGSGNFQIIVDVSQNASQILKSGTPITTWSYNATDDYIAINTTSLSVWELDFGSSTLSSLTVGLDTPNGDEEWASTINFLYTPVVTGDIFYNASIWSNVTGTWSLTQTNTTAILNSTINSISSTISTTMTLIWNVEVWNSTHGVFASANYTLIITSMRIAGISLSIIVKINGISVSSVTKVNGKP